jgi:AraC family transcriptional regulator
MDLDMEHVQPTRHDLRAKLVTVADGDVTSPALPDHVVRVHASAFARGTCRMRRFGYTRGDVDIVPAGTADAWHADDPFTSVVLRVPPALLRRVAEELGNNPDRIALAPRHHIRDLQIEHIAWALEAERQLGEPGGLVFRESLGIALATVLLQRHASAGRDRAQGLTPAELGRLTAYIEAHLDRELSIARLAEIAGKSPSHLKTLFRRSTGAPVHTYIVQRRVERARTLLLAGKLPAAQVALAAGFAHQSHMARWMRRLLGIAPDALRRR